MENIYENVAALAGRTAGPLASYLGPFVTSLINQQYAATVIYIKITHALAFDRWVAKRGVLGDTHIERYQRRSRRRHQRIRTETRRREPFEVMQLLQFLRSRAV
jgi:hypothetical protein